MFPRAAAIDCGTNSLRLLIAERTPAGVVDVRRDTRVVRLGEGVDATGEFAPAALARTFAQLEVYAAAVRAAGVSAPAIRCVATSAARDVANRAEFFAGVRERLGVEVEVLPGQTEAELSFAGAVAGFTELAGPVLVTDLGGGSTELVLGVSGRIDHAVSLDIGAVRLRERFLRNDPPRADEIEGARAYVDAQLDASGVPFLGASTWLGVAGTFSSLAVFDLGLDRYVRDRVHGHRISRARLAELNDFVLTREIAELIELMPGLEPGRAAVLCGGTLIAERLAARIDVAATVSESDILDGLVASLW
ncbi:Ppx/GppA phosphatase family protein [Granulicoccus phenolivorans]|uniref:Ppx/GppA phosphatase family protein n=1 Tax=Granulicoccus phenolivorans TaxID=266854 RepID=UPI0004059DB6|nr:Ppx/GppA phosphatase family protein [Granulicoccus phenolivorans]